MRRIEHALYGNRGLGPPQQDAAEREPRLHQQNSEVKTNMPHKDKAHKFDEANAWKSLKIT